MRKREKMLVIIAAITTLGLFVLNYAIQNDLSRQKNASNNTTDTASIPSAMPSATKFGESIAFQRFGSGQEDVILTGKLSGEPYTITDGKTYIVVQVHTAQGEIQKIPVFLGLIDERMSLGLIDGANYTAPSRYTSEPVIDAVNRFRRGGSVAVFITTTLSKEKIATFRSNPLCLTECQRYVSWVEAHGEQAKDFFINVSNPKTRAQSPGFDVLAEQVGILRD